MADDLIDTLDASGIEKATICGHSLGGKVAMVAALRAPERFSKLIVVDIAPVAYDHNHPGWKANVEIMDAMQNKHQMKAELWNERNKNAK